MTVQIRFNNHQILCWGQQQVCYCKEVGRFLINSIIVISMRYSFFVIVFTLESKCTHFNHLNNYLWEQVFQQRLFKMNLQRGNQLLCCLQVHHDQRQDDGGHPGLLLTTWQLWLGQEEHRLLSAGNASGHGLQRQDHPGEQREALHGTWWGRLGFQAFFFGSLASFIVFVLF